MKWYFVKDPKKINIKHVGNLTHIMKMLSKYHRINNKVRGYILHVSPGCVKKIRVLKYWVDLLESLWNFVGFLFFRLCQVPMYLWLKNKHGSFTWPIWGGTFTCAFISPSLSSAGPMHLLLWHNHTLATWSRDHDPHTPFPPVWSNHGVEASTTSNSSQGPPLTPPFMWYILAWAMLMLDTSQTYL
jgi:hypothetical protein